MGDQAVKNKKSREWLMQKMMTGSMANAIIDMDNLGWCEGIYPATKAREEAWLILVDAAEAITGKLTNRHGWERSQDGWEQSQEKSRFDCAVMSLHKSMTARSTLRGNAMIFVDGEWQYEDTGEPTVGSDRPCGHCGEPSTADGHDACLGTLPGVMNACCGHGELSQAYVQMPDGAYFQGQDALDLINKLRG